MLKINNRYENFTLKEPNYKSSVIEMLLYSCSNEVGQCPKPSPHLWGQRVDEKVRQSSRETKTIALNVAESFGYGIEKVNLIFTLQTIKTSTQLEQGISGAIVDQTWMLKQ